MNEPLTAADVQVIENNLDKMQRYAMTTMFLKSAYVADVPRLLAEVRRLRALLGEPAAG